MAHIIQRFNRFNLKTGIAGHVEALACAVGLPGIAASQLHAAFAADYFHDFRRAGVEAECGWQDDADSFFGAVSKQDSVRNAFAIEVNVGFFDDADVVELGGHGEWVVESG